MVLLGQFATQFLPHVDADLVQARSRIQTAFFGKIPGGPVGGQGLNLRANFKTPAFWSKIIQKVPSQDSPFAEISAALYGQHN